ncbi:head decoration protein [Pelosinus sp. IPA-1]|uniref:head decoration protein n=1 Tax=Pelosinus sp. IPA-1 TaxID=3029569 RepID=UPI0024362AE1|nr:head decoration protein [Pelosinus sp. IPA-1]GMB00429.1 hypothetical protein PIPA1_32280 [Pelosinus sp. IPA-1]
MSELVGTAATFSYKNLVGGVNPPIHTSVETLAKGSGTYVSGAVLGKITAAGATQGKCQRVNSVNTDGSQTADSVLLTDNIDTTAADVMVVVAKSGCFNREALTFGGSDTVDKHEATLRDLNIYLTSSKGVGC